MVLKRWKVISRNGLEIQVQADDGQCLLRNVALGKKIVLSEDFK